MAIILKTVKWPYLGNGWTDLYEIWHVDAYRLCQNNEPNKMLFVGQTRVRPKNHILVVGAHWRILVNTINIRTPVGKTNHVGVTQTTSSEYH